MTISTTLASSLRRQVSVTSHRAVAPKHRGPVLKRATQHSKRITRLIEEGIDDGSLSSPNPIASCDVILGALNWIPKWYRPDSALAEEQIADAFVHTLTQGIKTR